MKLGLIYLERVHENRFDNQLVELTHYHKKYVSSSEKYVYWQKNLSDDSILCFSFSSLSCWYLVISSYFCFEVSVAAAIIQAALIILWQLQLPYRPKHKHFRDLIDLYVFFILPKIVWAQATRSLWSSVMLTLGQFKKPCRKELEWRATEVMLLTIAKLESKLCGYEEVIKMGENFTEVLSLLRYLLSSNCSWFNRLWCTRQSESVIFRTSWSKYIFAVEPWLLMNLVINLMLMQYVLVHFLFKLVWYSAVCLWYLKARWRN